MRSSWRTLGRSVPREIVAIAVSMWVVGASYGAAAHGIGLMWWQILLIACVVLAGSSEFVLISVVAAGGLPIVGALAGLLVNVRNFSYGLSAGRFLPRDPRRLAAAHLVNDETAVYSAPHRDPARARRAFLTCGLAVLVSWPLGALTGALVGGAIASPESLGLDAAFPALMIALALPALRDPATRWAAVFGGAIALATAGFAAAGVPVVLALLGIPIAHALTRRPPAARRRDPGAAVTGWTLVGAVALLACGTYAIRLAGVYLRARLRTSPAVDAILERATIVLLIAVGLTGALFAGQDVSGPAKPIGVAVAVVVASLRAPLVVVIVGAAATTAMLRLIGVP